ncbi:hypothetical protein G9A89_019224 [Geosiphon pyriformis]|nr:hypothetical protein G9A89_019224 [Geosiphon pyriformis]
MSLGLVKTLAVTGIFFLLVLLFASFPKDLGSVPEQDTSKLTGYPAWHPVIKAFEAEKYQAFVEFSFITLGVSGYYTLRWTSYTSKTGSGLQNSYFSKNGVAFPTTLFNRLLAGYVSITFIASVTYILFDIGKLWAITGSLHNVFEIAIMLVLHNGGKVTSHAGFFGLLAGYLILVNILSITLSWPFDGLWFKWQGLCSDWALIIQFTRLYYGTQKNLKENGTSLPIFTSTSEQGEIQSSSLGELIPEEQYNFFPTSVHHPRPLILLILAAIIHIIGNITNTLLVDNLKAFYAFQLSYTITYSLYSFYIYLDTHCTGITTPRKRIYVPDTSRFKVICVVLWSIFLSSATIRLTVWVQQLINKD